MARRMLADVLREAARIMADTSDPWVDGACIAVERSAVDYATARRGKELFCRLFAADAVGGDGHWYWFAPPQTKERPEPLWSVKHRTHRVIALLLAAHVAEDEGIEVSA